MTEKQDFRLSKEKLCLELDEGSPQDRANNLEKRETRYQKPEKICISLPSSVVTAFKVWCSYNRFTMGKGVEVLFNFYNKNKDKNG